LFFLVFAAAAAACPLCYEAARQVMSDGVQLDMADRVVPAEPASATGQLRIVAIVKGKDLITRQAPMATAWPVAGLFVFTD
jgi:hypothetical protein